MIKSTYEEQYEIHRDELTDSYGCVVYNTMPIKKGFGKGCFEALKDAIGQSFAHQVFENEPYQTPWEYRDHLKTFVSDIQDKEGNKLCRFFK